MATATTPTGHVRMDVLITPGLDRALDELVTTTGVAKAALVRKAVALYLAEQGVLSSEVAEAVPLIPTHGPGLSRHRHRKDR